MKSPEFVILELGKSGHFFFLFSNMYGFCFIILQNKILYIYISPPPPSSNFWLGFGIFLLLSQINLQKWKCWVNTYIGSSSILTIFVDEDKQNNQFSDTYALLDHYYNIINFFLHLGVYTEKKKNSKSLNVSQQMNILMSHKFYNISNFSSMKVDIRI